MMGIFTWPKKLFYAIGSSIALYLVKRRVKKGQAEPYVWLVLARLYEIRGEIGMAVRTLENGLKNYPGNSVLKNHLNRLKLKIS
ncbi:MAG TPA: hypothetical protein ENG14_04750 [Thermodesulforhabdus norvegica]|uniref:Tetratricopeptide repeat protein n=1 Tax=Thermodesulforhabdus norvegica TaxID=39841 RepID=A0A7C0WUT7_9BACT|nr:hypothetical protein [Thermodesulforhabdus norvegica]